MNITNITHVIIVIIIIVLIENSLLQIHHTVIDIDIVIVNVTVVIIIIKTRVVVIISQCTLNSPVHTSLHQTVIESLCVHVFQHV